MNSIHPEGEDWDSDIEMSPSSLENCGSEREPLGAQTPKNWSVPHIQSYHVVHTPHPRPLTVLTAYLDPRNKTLRQILSFCHFSFRHFQMRKLRKGSQAGLVGEGAGTPNPRQSEWESACEVVCLD